MVNQSNKALCFVLVASNTSCIDPDGKLHQALSTDTGRTSPGFDFFSGQALALNSGSRISGGRSRGTKMKPTQILQTGVSFCDVRFEVFLCGLEVYQMLPPKNPPSDSHQLPAGVVPELQLPVWDSEKGMVTSPVQNSGIATCGLIAIYFRGGSCQNLNGGKVGKRE